ncbi:MAG TPA: peroxiredoxin [Actinomycetales bacterium]|nr:peroxiredoxin [Actinomycetales bacterium]
MGELPGYDPTRLPEDLPSPVDDGAADHLLGRRVPALTLPATSGDPLDLSVLTGRTVVYAYPRTGRPDEAPLVEDWDTIPGARGCTPESCAFRDHYAELRAAGAGVVGLSTQDPDYQREAATRLHLPYPLLSDADLALTRALDLPTFEAAGQVLLRRLTLLVRDGVVEHVWYPVFPPDSHPQEVLSWLLSNPR